MPNTIDIEITRTDFASYAKTLATHAERVDLHLIQATEFVVLSASLIEKHKCPMSDVIRGHKAGTVAHVRLELLVSEVISGDNRFSPLLIRLLHQVHKLWSEIWIATTNNNIDLDLIPMSLMCIVRAVIPELVGWENYGSSLSQCINRLPYPLPCGRPSLYDIEALIANIQHRIVEIGIAE